MIQYRNSSVSEKCGPQEMFQVKVCGPAVRFVVGQSMGWSHTVAAPFQVSELNPQTFSRGPRTARPWVCVSTLMKL